MTSADPASMVPILREPRPKNTTWTPRESSVTAGVSRTDITPPIGIRAHNWGASRAEIATGVHRPLTATALAFLDGASPTWRYLVTLDLGWWRDLESFHRLRDPILARIQATADDLLIHLVHTHAGPSICDIGLDLPGASLIDEYHENLIAAVVDACIAAKETAAPSIITWAYGKSDLAVVRNLTCGNRDVVAFDPEKIADDTIAIGRITLQPKPQVGNESPITSPQVVGTLVNYACHPTTLAYENSLLSPDFIGGVRDVVETETGAPCLFLQGASGELSPRDQYVVGPETADLHGRSLGHAAMATIAGMSAPGTQLNFDGVVESGAPLGIWRIAETLVPSTTSFAKIVVPLAAKAPRSPEEVAAQWSDIDPVAAAERERRSSRLAGGYLADDAANHPVWLWQLGDAVIVAHPGEAFSAFQSELRHRHQDRMLLVLNLTNGPGFVYLPDRHSYQRDRYQVWQTLLAAGCLEELIEVVDTSLTALPKPRKVMT